MEWTQVVALIAGNLAVILPLWLWNRSESRADMRHMTASLEAHRQETNSLITAIKEDIKDFHGRLCAIEERRKGDK